MSQGLAALRERKKELLLESDINRQILRVEFCQLRIKATEWRRGLLKVRTAYNWIAPFAGMGAAFFMIRKRLRAEAGTKHNGRSRGKSALMKLIAPLGFAALRQAYGFWRHARKRNGSHQ
jgi:hypothetical protein